jgi:hypothetical protein
MRFAVKKMTWGVTAILFAVAVFIIIKALQQTTCQWGELGMFLTGLAGFVGTALYMKKEQKKSELGIAKDKKVNEGENGTN